MNLERPALRLSGLLVLIICLSAYDPEHGSVLHRLLIPLTMALASWALVQNVAAVALGSMVLAFIHTDLAASDWIARIGYPILTGLSALILAVVAWRRFKQRIRETHEARWSDRSPS
jgi:multidrug transporter EmrE-like cation transporter